MVHGGPTRGFLLFSIQISTESSALLHYCFVIICVVLRCFTCEMGDPTRIKHIFLILNCIRIKDKIVIV